MTNIALKSSLTSIFIELSWNVFFFAASFFSKSRNFLHLFSSSRACYFFFDWLYFQNLFLHYNLNCCAHCITCVCGIHLWQGIFWNFLPDVHLIKKRGGLCSHFAAFLMSISKLNFIDSLLDWENCLPLPQHKNCHFHTPL